MRKLILSRHVEFATVILTACFPVLPKFVQYTRYGRRGKSGSTSKISEIGSGDSQKKSFPLRKMNFSSGTESLHSVSETLNESGSATSRPPIDLERVGHPIDRAKGKQTKDG